MQLFQARDQEPLPTYVKGRTVLIGDAAHAMVPYQGQGANQALEDVEGLDTLLANVLDCGRIPGLLQVWDSVRRPRASQIQRDSRTSQTKIATKDASAAILSVQPHISMKEALAQLQPQEGIDVPLSSTASGTVPWRDKGKCTVGSRKAARWFLSEIRVYPGLGSNQNLYILLNGSLGRKR